MDKFSMDGLVAEMKERLLLARLEALEGYLQEKFPDARERLGELLVEASIPRTARIGE